MVIALSGFIRTDAAGRKTLALARAVNHVLSAHGLPVGRFAFGQTTPAEAVHQAINEALARRRMIVTPTDPRNAWRIGYDFFERLAQEVVDATRSMGFTVAIREAEEALVARGYRPSAPPPVAVPTVILATEKRTAYRQMALQYAVTAVLTEAPDVEAFPGRKVAIMAERFSALVTQIVETANQPGWATNPGFLWEPPFQEEEAAKDLQIRGYQPATLTEPPTIRTIIIQPIPQPEPAYDMEPEEAPPQRWEPVPIYEVATQIPPVYTPVVVEEAAVIDKNTVLMIVGGVVGGLALASMMTRQR